MLAADVGHVGARLMRWGELELEKSAESTRRPKGWSGGEAVLGCYGFQARLEVRRWQLVGLKSETTLELGLHWSHPTA